jgi:hypothetical protein
MEIKMSLLPRLGSNKFHFDATLATAIGTGIAAVELLDIKLGRRECPARTGLPALVTKISFVGGVATPFAKTTPEAPKETRGVFCGTSHQSSPWTAPEKSAAQRVAMYGDS